MFGRRPWKCRTLEQTRLAESEVYIRPVERNIRRGKDKSNDFGRGSEDEGRLNGTRDAMYVS